METIDEGLAINSNMSTISFKGILSVYIWRFGLTSKKLIDDFSRVPLTISLRFSSSVSIMKMNMEHLVEVLGKPTIRNRM